MALVSHDFETGTNGATVATGGGIGAVVGACTYTTSSPIRGNVSVSCTGTGAAGHIQSDNTTANTAVIQFEWSCPSLPTSSNADLLVLRSTTSNDRFIFQARTAVNGQQLSVMSQNFGSTVWTSSGTYSTGTVYRTDISVSAPSGTQQAVIQTCLQDSTTPIAGLSGTISGQASGTWGTAGWAWYQLGKRNVPGNWTVKIDSFRHQTGTTTFFDPPGLQKIAMSTTRLSSTSVSVAWTNPGDAPDGVTIVRAPGSVTNDGLGNTPSESDYDPLTVSGATVVAEGQTSSPYTDSGLTPGTYTYWVARTAP